MPATLTAPADIAANAARIADALALSPGERARLTASDGPMLVLSHRFTPAGYAQVETVGRVQDAGEMIALIDDVVDDRFVTQSRVMTSEAFLLFDLHADEPALNVLSLRASGLYAYRTAITAGDLSQRTVAQARTRPDDFVVDEYRLVA